MEIIPSTFSEYPNASPGEREIFKKLKSSSEASHWIVLHSLDLLNHINKSQSEADFVFLIPNVGVLVLEVKSSKTVTVNSEGWQLGQKREKRGPFNQANDAMRSIMSYLDTVEYDYKDVPFVYAVWFTHIPRNSIPTSMAWTPEQVLSSEDMKLNVVEVIKRTTTELVANLKITKSATPAPLHKLREISQILLPRFVAHQLPAERQKDVNVFLETALTEQLEMFRLITGLKSVLLQGLAGTGKTFIAMQAARLAHERGERVLFLCYNAMLAEYLKEKLKNFSLVRVSSLHGLMLETSGLEFPENASSEWWETILPEAATIGAPAFAAMNNFDTLIVDEAQDIGALPNLIFLDLILTNGLIRSRTLFCGDFKHQGVYIDGQKSLENYMSLIPTLQVLDPLLTNCRNTQMLGDFLVELLQLDPKYDSFRRKDSDCELLTEVLSSEIEIPKTLSKLLADFLKKFTPEQVVVLSAQKGKLAAVIENLKFKVTEIRNPRTGYLRWGSVQEFKGLEALAVVLVEFNSENEVLPEIFYVGATRSVHDFALVISQSKLTSLVEVGL